MCIFTVSDLGLRDQSKAERTDVVLGPAPLVIPLDAGHFVFVIGFRLVQCRSRKGTATSRHNMSFSSRLLI